MSPMYLSLSTFCSAFLILIICRFHGVDAQIPDGYHQAVGCFSNMYNNFLELSCVPGEVISVEWVIFGTRPNDGCPSDGSLSIEQAHCCAPRCGDCVVENERDSQNVFNCDGKKECSVWTMASWVEGCLPMKSTTYMVVLYKCNNSTNVISNVSSNTFEATPTFNNIYCGHSGGITHSGATLPSSASPPTATPRITGPRHIVGCYSTIYKQRIKIECQRGEGIAVYGVFFAAKAYDYCPVDGFIGDTEKIGCCEPECGDCVISQSSEASYVYKNCSGERTCEPWTHRIQISDCGLQQYTSYMVVHYECVRDFVLPGGSTSIGTSFESLFGCPLPPTTIPPTTTTITTTTTTTTTTSTTTTSTSRTPSTSAPTQSTTKSTSRPRRPTTPTPRPTTTLRNYDGTYVAVGCYSSIYKPKVEITCERETHILIHGVFFGTREIDLCPESGVITKGSESCCEPKCEDCYTYGGHGEVKTLLSECTYQQNCSVWTQRSVMTDCGAKSFSAYMAVHYQCTQTGMDAARTMSFEELYCPHGTNSSRPTMSRPSLVTTIRPTSPPTVRLPVRQPQTSFVSNSGKWSSRVTRPTGTPPTGQVTREQAGPKAYPDNSNEPGQADQKVLIGGMVGGIASVIALGVIFVLVLHWRKREKNEVTNRNSLERNRKIRKRNISKNNSQCTNSTHLNSVIGPSNLTMVNVISNNGRLPGKGDYNHLARWLGDLETTNDNFDLPRISEVSESDTDADIENRVRRITTFPQRQPDNLHESDS